MWMNRRGIGTIPELDAGEVPIVGTGPPQSSMAMAEV